MGIVKNGMYKVSYFIKMFIFKISYRDSLQIGKNFSFRKRFDININGEGMVRIGSHVFFNSDCSINCKKEIYIGDNCIFGENVRIYDHNHRFSDYSRPIQEQGYKLQKIVIGNNCWIGSNVILLPGSEIESNSIIGAGCVISGRIPEGMIVTSNRKLQFARRNRDEK